MKIVDVAYRLRLFENPRMRRALALIPVCLFLSSCVTRDHLSQEVGPVPIKRLQNLSGSYEDRSVERTGTGNRRLVTTLLGVGYTFPPVDRVRLSVPQTGVLSCSAISNEQVIKHKNLKQGVDFDLGDGRLAIKPTSGLDSIAEGAAIWVERKSNVVRLLATGDLLVRERTVDTGVFFAVIPMRDTREVDFLHRRISR